ncbi:hypothetical protein KC19_8G191500 [Ceratodon purpureus]|uniref:Uncharacterized protein n=1 Tax=Ceratodon purpureus TaxID=3225 RepID=A0A8T0H4X8_CERPU|nr:hypothetical protein KC19_8G191500 [Ceratodon purpureus]
MFPGSKELENESKTPPKLAKPELGSDIKDAAGSSSREDLRNSATAEDDPIVQKTQEVELEVVIEQMPKWKFLREVLEEIEEERQRLKLERATEGPSETTRKEEEDAVVIACKDERMCLQLQQVVLHGTQEVNLTLGLLCSFQYPLLY